MWPLIDDNVFTNPYVYIDVTIGIEQAGRIVVELFNVTTPKTAKNFGAQSTGEKGTIEIGKPFNFKGLTVQIVTPGLMYCHLGGEHICLFKYGDENFVKKHIDPRILARGNAGQGTNGSQFLICTNKAERIYGKQLVYGQVVGGMNVLKAIEKVKWSSKRTSKPVVDCGQLWI